MLGSSAQAIGRNSIHVVCAGSFSADTTHKIHVWQTLDKNHLIKYIRRLGDLAKANSNRRRDSFVCYGLKYLLS